MVYTIMERDRMRPTKSSRAEKEMKPVKKTKQESPAHVTHTSASDEVEEEVVPSGAALVSILLTGLLYFALPPNVIIGPNWLVLGVALLILALSKVTLATNLLRSAVLLWLFNILVFALWYWELDGGGPWKRHLSGHRAADFQFPQQAHGKSWAPHFFDYLFLAFTGATALSPADTNPLTTTAKALMMLEAVLSLTIVGLLIARAVNILAVGR